MKILSLELSSIFSIILASALIYYHWEAMLVSYLATRKTVMPFAGLDDMYSNTNYRLALLPATTYEDSFRFSRDPLLKSIYEERFLPHREEYMNYENRLTDMAHFIREDSSTALYDSHIPTTATKDYQDCVIVATEGNSYTMWT